MPYALAVQCPGELRVHEKRIQYSVDLCAGASVLEWGENFDSPVEISGQQIRAADPRPALLATLKGEDATVLKESPEHAPHW
jgi:hypothetical protein